MAYYGEPTMAPAVFLEAYIQSTNEEFHQSKEAPKIDAKNPAGWSLPSLRKWICSIENISISWIHFREFIANNRRSENTVLRLGLSQF